MIQMSLYKSGDPVACRYGKKICALIQSFFSFWCNYRNERRKSGAAHHFSNSKNHGSNNREPYILKIKSQANTYCSDYGSTDYSVNMAHFNHKIGYKYL